MKNWLCILLAFLSFHAFGQYQVRFDVETFPSIINPAFAGLFDEGQVFASRSQEKYMSTTALTSYLAGLNVKFNMVRHPNASSAITAHYVDEALNYAEGVHSQAVVVGYSHQIAVDKKSNLGAGIQIAYHYKHLNMKGFTTGSQYITNEGFHPDHPINEQIEYYSVHWPAAGAGIAYYRTVSKSSSFVIGIAGFGLNRPVTSTGEKSIREKIPITMNYTHTLKMSNNKLHIHPGISFFTFNTLAFRLSTLVTYQLQGQAHNFNAVSLQFTHTIDQSTCLGINIKHPKIGIGMNYRLYQAGIPLQGATEIKLVYRIGKKKQEKTTEKGIDTPEKRQFYAFEQNKAVEKACNRKEAEKVDFRLSRYVDFKINSGSLSQEARRYLDELISILASDKGLNVEITGHTDNTGTEDVNNNLSQRRAKAVADYLMANGIHHSRVNIQGKGSREPLNKNASPGEKARNRRVDIRIYK